MNSLPFKLGKFYKLLPNKGFQNLWLKNYEQLGVINNTNYSYSSSMPTIGGQYEHGSRFEPIAFNEKDQVVTARTMYRISEKSYQMTPVSNGMGINFSNNEFTTTRKIPVEVEIPVLTFIEDFELVL